MLSRTIARIVTIRRLQVALLALTLSVATMGLAEPSPPNGAIPRIVPSLAHPGQITFVDFSPDASLVLSLNGVYGDLTLKLWDVATGRLLRDVADPSIDVW